MTSILPGNLGVVAAASAGYSAFDPTKVFGTTVTLSNNNRTIAATNFNYEGTLGNRRDSSGQRYFEMRLDSLTSNLYLGVGVADPSWVPGMLGETAGHSAGLARSSTSNNWTMMSGGSPASPGFATPATVGDVIGVAVNFNINPSGTQAVTGVYFRLNSLWLNYYLGGNPQPGYPTTGPDFGVWAANTSAVIGVNVGFVQFTLNVGNTAFAYAPPAGYSAWG